MFNLEYINRIIMNDRNLTVTDHEDRNLTVEEDLSSFNNLETL